MNSSDDKPNGGLGNSFFGLLGLGPLLDFFDIDRARAEYRHALEQEMRSRVDLARSLAQERQTLAGAERSSETIRREEEPQALELKNSEGHRFAYLNLRELDSNDICVRFVKPGDPVSDADRAQKLLMLVGRNGDTIESIRELIAVPPEIERTLRLFVLEHPEESDGVERVLEFRRRSQRGI
jgi:hypothetical protein